VERFSVPRISKDDLGYCREHNECLDCHLSGIVKSSAKTQTRGKLKVPCCVPHFNAYRSKLSQANSRKYRRSSEAKERAGRCVYKGCHNKLIPQELLPPWIRERTCGLHGAFKAFRINRTAIVQFIDEHCLSEDERKGTVQNIVYKPKQGIVFIGLRYDNRYQTKLLSARNLIQQYLELRQK
jgi:hypothetical protein